MQRVTTANTLKPSSSSFTTNIPKTLYTMDLKLGAQPSMPPSGRKLVSPTKCSAHDIKCPIKLLGGAVLGLVMYTMFGHGLARREKEVLSIRGAAHLLRQWNDG